MVGKSCLGQELKSCSLKYLFINYNHASISLQEYPDEFVKRLFALGVDCYRSASQLNIIEPAACWSEDSRQGAATLQHFVTHYPHEAKYLMDQLVYLPFHKHMSFQFLDHMCKLISVVLQNMSVKSLPPPPLNTQIKAKL